MARVAQFQSIRSEGGLLPPDLLRRILETDGSLEGLRPEDYQLAPGERIGDVTTQSWNRLRRYWADFRDAAARLGEDESGTALTNEKWTLPLLRELAFGPLPVTAGPTVGDRTFPIARFVGPVPVHLLGCRVSLDRRTARARGASEASPHALVQEYLNRSPNALWGVLCNGLRLRLLRDHQALSRQAYFEVDLEAMFDGELYADFVLLWLVAHHTRIAPRAAAQSPEAPATAAACWLERWTQVADEQGTRALGDLREGVQRALQTLGAGFSSHPRNAALRDALRSGTLPLADFHGQLLRIVYRLIFLFVAEDRTLDGQPLLHARDESPQGGISRERYARHYGTARLREMASRIRGSRHGDLWKQFQVVTRGLSGAPDGQGAREALALPPLGSLLWSPAATGALNGAELENHDLLEVVRRLAFTRQGNSLRAVDYRNLGAEELGGVYETLLGLTPQLSSDGQSFTFAEFAGNERKMSGSYYTPDVLVQCLLDSALDPVVSEAVKGKTGAAAEEAILSLKVCDPAVGSGHFLVGAAHRLARHLSRVRAHQEGESEPSPLLYQQALRDVIGRCLYGVDINPMSAELCRVGLWLEAFEPGKPLSFLDHHIRVGNSLLGATPELLAGGIPDDAFAAIEGDDKRACTALRKRNKGERKGLGPLFSAQEAEQVAQLAQSAGAIDVMRDDRPELVAAKYAAFRAWQSTDAYRERARLADTWCAGFVIEKQFAEAGRESSARGITSMDLRCVSEGRSLPEALDKAIEGLTAAYQFFHWHLAFPEVFACGGFDCVLGNPPWERVKIQEKEWFAERSPAIAAAPNAAARKRLIEALETEDPSLFAAFRTALRQAEGESQILRNSGRYPLCGRGDINVYTVFAENMRSLLRASGLAGFIVPIGIATDDTTKHFFQDVVATGSLVALAGFENEENVFPAVHHAFKFCLLTLASPTPPVRHEGRFTFFARQVDHLSEPERQFTLSADDIALLNPNTRTCPIFRTRRDAEVTKAIYRRVPVLVREPRGDEPEVNSWGVRFATIFHMANDSHLFRTRGQLETEGWTLVGNRFTRQVAGAGGTSREELYLPLYEAKMIHHFDHRWATYDGVESRNLTPEEKQNPTFVARGRYWVREQELDSALQGTGWTRQWLLGWRDISRSTDERTVLFSLIPRAAAGNTCPILLSGESAAMMGVLAASLTSFAHDFCARQKVGGTHLTFGALNQLPVLAPSTLRSETRFVGSLIDWISPRVAELSITAEDMSGFARDLAAPGPFKWDADRRFMLRCELDAAFFHLYLPATADGAWAPAEREAEQELQALSDAFSTPQDAVAHIMDTFPIVRRRDEERHGTYRTKEMILEIYQAMQAAIRTGVPYQTRLDPPPADPRCCHPAPSGEAQVPSCRPARH